MRNYLFLATILLTSLNVHAEEKSYYTIPQDVKCMVKKSDKITYCYDLKGKPITGEMRRYSNGLIKHRYALENGILNGTTYTYYRDGTIKSKKNYIKGKLNGLKVENFRDGKPQEETSYKNGKKEGVSKIYLENGLLLSQTVFKNNKINGDYRIYDSQQRLVYNFKGENDILVSGNYYYTTANNQIKSVEIPNLIITALKEKCAKIKPELSDDKCAVEEYEEKCNINWIDKNKAKLNEYFTQCRQSE